MGKGKYASLKVKLLVSFLGVVILQLISYSILYLAFMTSTKEVEKLALSSDLTLSDIAESIRLQDLVLRDSVRGILIRPDNDADRQTYLDYSAKLDLSIKQALDAEKNNADSLATVQELDMLNSKLMDLEKQMVDPSVADAEQAAPLYDGEYLKLRDDFKTKAEKYLADKKAVFYNNASETLETALMGSAKALKFGSAGNSLVLILAIFISVAMGNRLGKTVSGLSSMTREMSKGNYSIKWDSIKRNNDETDILSDSLRKLSEDVRDLIAKVQQSAESLGASSQHLSTSTQQTSVATRESNGERKLRS